jgi:predicted nucleic acid-binding protein
VNIVDSSCWLEYFAGSETGERVAPIIENLDALIVPSITLYEVFRKLLQELDEDKALFALAHMKQGKVIDLDAALALYAAQLGREHKLPLADSVIFATALRHEATLYTQDRHFMGLKQVRYFEKKPL